MINQKVTNVRISRNQSFILCVLNNKLTVCNWLQNRVIPIFLCNGTKSASLNCDIKAKLSSKIYNIKNDISTKSDYTSEK